MNIPSGLTKEEADAYVQENHGCSFSESEYGDLIDIEYRPQDSELYPNCEFDAVYLEEYIEGEGEEVLSKNVDTRSINNIKFNMVYCPAGEFWMGSEQGVGDDDERPRHRVKMTKGFWMGETQVTQQLWKAVMGWNPSYFEGSVWLPAESMTWYDCLVFCNQLSELEGFKPCYALSQIKKDGDHIESAEVEWKRDANGYRLPTEAEWEYCAKAGTELTYSGTNTIDEVAWYTKNSGRETHAVKTKKANAWGLYDMTGNVWEWCHDTGDEAYQNRVNAENPVEWQNGPCARVLRGGSYVNLADYCRVADRSWNDADSRDDSQGLRLLRFEP
jgi:formylglycine-generating enzyme required for sulfatase activity